MGVQHTLEILNYTAPAAVLLYWFITTVVSLTAVHVPQDDGRKSPRRIVVTFMLLIATTYVSYSPPTYVRGLTNVSILGSRSWSDNQPALQLERGVDNEG